MPSEVSKKLKKLRQRAGLSLYEVAHKLGMPQASSYQHYETRYKKPFLPLDLVLALRPILMRNGIERREIDELAGINANEVQAALKEVPVVSWVEAGKMVETADPYPIGGAGEFVSVDSECPTLIALRVAGNSMDRIAPPHSLIIVDYTQKSLIDGKYYVFRLGGEATFKRFRSGPDRLEPYSTSPEHQIIFPSDGLEIVGRVVKVILDL